jgi:hypothetical protein
MIWVCGHMTKNCLINIWMILMTKIVYYKVIMIVIVSCINHTILVKVLNQYLRINTIMSNIKVIH